MKLLVITQKINKNDPVLGFFHRWVVELASAYEAITVICLEKGEYDVPHNVSVLSLGKEGGQSKWKYLKNFYTYIFLKRKEYDAVFVHMNEEYVLLGGFLWKLLRKPIYMWRNHHAGSEFTNIVSLFCKNIFCTSKYSYTAKFKKTIRMPVGVDTSVFVSHGRDKKPHSILFLARIAPVKKPDVLIRALGILAQKKVPFSATIVGDALPKDSEYADSLRVLVKDEGVSDKVVFLPGIPNDQTPEVYSSHEVFVNLSSSGMYDKTIFEAMSCETLVLASNENLRGLIDEDFIFTEGDVVELASKLERIILMDRSSRVTHGAIMRDVVLKQHSLDKLRDKLVQVIH